MEDLIHIEGSDNVHHESGLFDECLSVQPDGVPFQGQYCTIFFKLKAVQEAGDDEYIFDGEEEKESVFTYQKPSVSFCLPSTCTAGDLNSAFDQLLGFRVVNGQNFSIVPIGNAYNCYTKEKIQANSTFDAVTITIL